MIVFAGGCVRGFRASGDLGRGAPGRSGSPERPYGETGACLGQNVYERGVDDAGFGRIRSISPHQSSPTSNVSPSDRSSNVYSALVFPSTMPTHPNVPEIPPSG